jgi:hypothetical protein
MMKTQTIKPDTANISADDSAWERATARAAELQPAQVTQEDTLWFQRRAFVQGAAAFVASGLWLPAHAQSRSNIVAMEGEVLHNSRPIQKDAVIQTGDIVQTGANGIIIFVLGNSSYAMRRNSLLRLDRGLSINFVSALRLLTGGVAAVFGKGRERSIVTSTLTAGIRGTGIYFEAEPERTYFCNCYGTIDLAAGGDRLTTVADYHDSFFASLTKPKDGKFIWPTKPRNHTDQELETLARLVDQSTGWAGMPADMRKRKADEKGIPYDGSK